MCQIPPRRNAPVNSNVRPFTNRSSSLPTKRLSRARLELEINLLNAEAQSVSSSDLYAWLRESRLPDEAAIRLTAFVDTVKEIGQKAISIGKIVLLKIIEFVKAHPNLAVGIAIGAAIGVLVSMIPFIGTYLAPIATVFSIGIGAVAGHRMDRREQGGLAANDSSLLPFAEDIIDLARTFFKLLAEIFNGILNPAVSN